MAVKRKKLVGFSKTKTCELAAVSNRRPCIAVGFSCTVDAVSFLPRSSCVFPTTSCFITPADSQKCVVNWYTLTKSNEHSKYNLPSFC